MSETYSWENGKTTCENKGASLAELKTDDEFYTVEIVLLAFGKRPFYICNGWYFSEIQSSDLFRFELN